jgi:hypothetical protein
MLKGHIFVQHPRNTHDTCWSCGEKKEEHSFTVQHRNLQVSFTKISKKQKRVRVISKQTNTL